MAPSKFGLFKARSRDHADQPSTENLLQGTSSEKVDKPPSPIPSTSRGLTEGSSTPDFSMLPLYDSDDDDFVPEKCTTQRRGSTASLVSQGEYHRLKNESSLVNSLSTLQVDLDQIQCYEYQGYEDPDFDDPYDNDSTTFDANSLQFDETSIAASEDWSVYCAMLKKPKKTRSKDQQLSDTDMWKASNLEVMQNDAPRPIVEGPNGVKKLGKNTGRMLRDLMPTIPETAETTGSPRKKTEHRHLADA